MVTLLLTIIGDIIAGVAVHGITQGFSNSGGNQTVIIENAFFNTSDVKFSSRNRSGNASSEDLFWGLFFGVLILFGLILTALVGLSALYVQHINLILNIGFWGAIGMAVIGGILLIVGIVQGSHYKDWSVFQVALYSLFLCLVVGGLVWLVYAPPNAPAGYEEVFRALQNLNLHGDSWTSEAIEIGMGDEFLSVNPVIKF